MAWDRDAFGARGLGVTQSEVKVGRKPAIINFQTETLASLGASRAQPSFALSELMARLPLLVAPAKSISVFPGWADPEPETNYVWFNAPLEIGGVTEPGLVLHGGCYIHRPDCNVTFELRLGRATLHRAVALERIDWRSLQGGHTNQRRHGGDGGRVSWTHVHLFGLNWIDTRGRMRAGNLPLAKDIDEQLNDFADVLEFTGKQFKINNIGVVSEPGWEYGLDLGASR